MSPEDFVQVTDVLRDAHVMVDTNGRVVASNRAARKLFTDHGLEPPQHLDECLQREQGPLGEFLRQCARRREPTITTVQLQAEQQVTKFRCEGALLSPRAGDEPAQVMLSLIPKEASDQPFAVLNDKLAQLSREVDLRKETEASLQQHLRLSEFGREFGLVLSRRGELDEMLRSCTDLVVEYLGAAFARIWLIDDSRDILILRASSGLYTHLDGSHSRVPVGQLKIGYIAESQTPHLTNQVIGDPRVNDQQWAEREKMVAFAGYPLIVDGTTIGVMAMFARQELSANVVKAMGSVANELAVGISRKQAERQLQKKAAELELADSRKNEFLAMLAHELRNPLAPIRSGLELLACDTSEREVVSTMLQQVDHIVRIVDDLLDVSRIMRGRIEMRKQPVAIREIITQSVEAVRPHLTAADHTLQIRGDEGDPYVDGDEVRLTQVVTNLLNNAIKYTPTGGEIHIEVSDDEHHVTIQVADNGIGIDPEFVPELFTMFAQASRSLDRSQGGLGIGLTLVKQIVDLHGGTVSASSNGREAGSTFTVQLPQCPRPQQSTPPPVTSKSDIASKRIMIVEDNLASAKLLARLLERHWGHELSIQADGPTALATASDFRPDLVFLDIGLPEMDGFEVARAMRNNPVTAGAFIVALTGYGTEEDRQKSADAGFDMHLVKPVSLDNLHEMFGIYAG